MEFTKMQGAGNDFIIINNITERRPIDAYGAIAKEACARKVSLGADGMIVVEPSTEADFRMVFFNSDGSLGEMCGNGARCICRYAYEHGLSGTEARFETTAGIVTGTRVDEENWRVQLNSPSVVRENLKVTTDQGTFTLDYAELGNPGIPHAAVPTADLARLDDDTLRRRGRALRYSKDFPKGANINFYTFQQDGSILEKTYERGVEDLTLACGTGSGTVAYFVVTKHLVPGNRVTIHVPGGTLKLEIVDGNKIFLTGPTRKVAEGRLFL